MLRFLFGKKPVDNNPLLEKRIKELEFDLANLKGNYNDVKMIKDALLIELKNIRSTFSGLEMRLFALENRPIAAEKRGRKKKAP